MDQPTSQNYQSETSTGTDSSAPTPQPSSEPANVVEVAPETAVVPGTENEAPVTVVVKPPRKSKLGAVIAIVFLILFLIGGGCLAYWYFGIYNKPENVALDAVRQLIEAPSVAVSGQISSVISEDSDSKVTFVVDFKNSSKTLPSSTTATLSIAERDNDNNIVDDHEISIDLGTAIMSDGVIYLQISNLQESFDRIVKNSDRPLNDDFADLVEDTIDLIDDEWWRISVRELAEDIAAVGQADDLADMYECLIDKANHADYSEIATIYANHPFIDVTKSNEKSSDAGETIYNIRLSENDDNLVSFVNSLPHTALAKDTYACYNYDEPYDEFIAEEYEPITKSDVEAFRTDLNEWLDGDSALTATINNGNHKLNQFKFNLDADGSKINGNLKFEYTKTEASAPENYRDFSELFKGIAEIFQISISKTDPEDLELDEFLNQGQN